MEADQPNLLEEHFDFTGRVLVLIKHVRHLLNADTLGTSVTFSSFGLTEVLNDTINEFTEVLTDWEINKNLLEEYHEVLAGEATYRLQTLELSEWVHGSLNDSLVQVGSHTRDIGNNVFDLVAVHHLLEEG